MTDLRALIPELQPFAQRLVDLGGRAGVNPRVTSTLRTYSEQERLYRAFLRGETHYPVAPPGASAHEFGFAFDMIAATQTDLHDLGSVWVGWGGIWSATDEVHFEYPGFRPPRPTEQRLPPEPGGPFYKLADFISGFVPGLGELQLVDTLVGTLDGNNDLASWYLQHPAEALRDLF